MEKARGKKRLAVDMDEDESEPEAEVDLNNEVADSVRFFSSLSCSILFPLTSPARFQFGASGRQTKFGRKISKPKSFVPTNKPTSAFLLSFSLLAHQRRQRLISSLELCRTARLISALSPTIAFFTPSLPPSPAFLAALLLLPSTLPPLSHQSSARSAPPISPSKRP